MRVLAVLQLPPPKHGASHVGLIIQESKKINSRFDMDYIRISTRPVYNMGLVESLFNLVLLNLRVICKLLFKSYDLIYITPCASGIAFYKDFLITVWVRLLSSRKMVYHLHNKGLKNNKYVPDFLKRIFFKSVKVILLSPLLSYDVEEFINKNEIRYLPNGLGQLREVAPHTKKHATKIQLLFLSNMISSKGIFVLLEACHLLKSENIDFECNFAGPWYQVKKEDFNAVVNEYNLEKNVKYLGAAYGADKEKIFKSTDIFVFPTFYPDECFPLVLLEAMSYGLPCITTNVAAIPEIITDEKEGLIIPPRDPLSLVQAIKKLITDSTLRDSIGKNAYEKYKERYLQSIFEDNFIATIESLMKE